MECGQCVGLTILPPSVSRLFRWCGILNILQLYRSPRPATGITLLFCRYSRDVYFAIWVSLWQCFEKIGKGGHVEKAVLSNFRRNLVSPYSGYTDPLCILTTELSILISRRELVLIGTLGWENNILYMKNTFWTVQILNPCKMRIL
jgi:hypothetical protein